ncbi:MAG: hypothetical protein AAGE01_13335 [Pseudomonadota bacterium]
MNRRSQPNPENVLRSVFKFTDDDLAANQAGAITAAQLARISEDHHRKSRTAWQLSAGILGIGLFGFTAALTQEGYTVVNAVLLYLGFATFIASIVFGFVRYFRWKLQRTVRNGRIRTVEDRVWLVVERNNKTQSRFLRVGRNDFRLSDHGHLLLEKAGVNGRKATVFMSSPWKSVLSLVLED